MDYPVKTITQLRPLLLGFRKAASLTQTDMAMRLGITQQTYAQLEAKPESASVERVFKVLRLLGVSMTLHPDVVVSNDPLLNAPSSRVSVTGDPGDVAIPPSDRKRDPW